MYLGIDAGSTWTKVGGLNEEGDLLEFIRLSTPSQPDPERYFRWIKERIVEETTLLHATEGDGKVEGTGLGLAAPVDRGGTVPSHSHFRDGHAYDLESLISEVFSPPVCIINDATAAGLGEFWCGSGRDAEAFLMVTLGTGVGGSIILNGKPVIGEHGFAGEIGHMPLDVASKKPCSCGARGCLEAHVGEPALVEEYRKISEEDFDGTGQELIMKARDGNEKVKEILARAGRRIGKVLARIVSVLDPGRIVVGGGLSHGWSCYRDPLRDAMTSFLPEHFPQTPEIVPAKLGNKAGLTGVIYPLVDTSGRLQ